MLPALSLDQKVREKIGATARICASIGLYAIAVGIIPATKALGDAAGNVQKGSFYFAVIVAVIMVSGQCITLAGVREPRNVFRQEERTTLRGMFRAIVKNDQLLYAALSMALFMTGYCTTTGFGMYFFKYAYKNTDMFLVLAAVLGPVQIAALAVFPRFSKKFSRRQLYMGATILVTCGYVVFFFSPMNMAETQQAIA